MDVAGQHRIDRDPVMRELKRRRAHKTELGGLARRMV